MAISPTPVGDTLIIPHLIGREIRQRMSQYQFPSLQLASIVTGRDPRRFDSKDAFPQAVVQVTATALKAEGIGGLWGVYHSIEVFLVFAYGEFDDVGAMKEIFGSELFRFLADNKTGTYYQIFVNNQYPHSGMPQMEYGPDEESVYVRAGAHIALVKAQLAVEQNSILKF